jgi:hypothetical protein
MAKRVGPHVEPQHSLTEVAPFSIHHMPTHGVLKRVVFVSWLWFSAKGREIMLANNGI